MAATAQKMIAKGAYGHVVELQPLSIARKLFRKMSRYNNEVDWNKTISLRAKSDDRAKFIVKFFSAGYDSVEKLSFIDMELATTSLYAIAFNALNTGSGCPRITSNAMLEQLFSNVLNGLDFLHSVVGLLHNDVKPENILLKADGVFAFCDFGFAERIKGLKRLGTYMYAAPECYEESDDYKMLQDGASDVFSLGITLLGVVDAYPGVHFPGHIARDQDELSTIKDVDEWHEVKERMIANCVKFFKTSFHAPVAAGRNVKNVTFEWQYAALIASMVHPTSRPTCAELLRDFNALLTRNRRDVNEVVCSPAAPQKRKSDVLADDASSALKKMKVDDKQQEDRESSTSSSGSAVQVLSAEEPLAYPTYKPVKAIRISGWQYNSPVVQKAYIGKRILTPLETINVKPDGNCFYRAVALALSDDEELYMLFRTLTVHHLMRRFNNYRRYMDDPNVRQEDYIAEVDKDGTWATAAEIYALATRLNIGIYVYIINKSCPSRWVPTAPLRSTIERQPCIYLQLKDAHYTCVSDFVLKP